MQSRIIDSITPRAILSMAEFIKQVFSFTCHSSISQATSNPVALRRLGTVKVAQWATISLRSKFTNDFIPVPIPPLGLTSFT